MQVEHSGSARHFRLGLARGVSLHQSIVDALLPLGVQSASMTILGGNFSQLFYCTAPPDPSRNAVIAYTSPIALGKGEFIFGNAFLASGTDARPIIHCHAVLSAEAGVFGGHVMPHLSITGDHPPSVLVTSWEGFDLKVRFDAETNISLIQPAREQNDV